MLDASLDRPYYAIMLQLSTNDDETISFPVFIPGHHIKLHYMMVSYDRY